MIDGQAAQHDKWIILQRSLGALVVAALLAISGSIIGLRDTVRAHSIHIESLLEDQDEGRRFTFSMGEGVKVDISNLKYDYRLLIEGIKRIKYDHKILSENVRGMKDSLYGEKSREHERIKAISEKLSDMKKKIDFLETHVRDH